MVGVGNAGLWEDARRGDAGFSVLPADVSLGESVAKDRSRVTMRLGLFVGCIHPISSLDDLEGTLGGLYRSHPRGCIGHYVPLSSTSGTFFLGGARSWFRRDRKCACNAPLYLSLRSYKDVTKVTCVTWLV
jgi:hypothetical protein